MVSEATWNPALWEAAGGRVPAGWSLVPFADLLESPKSIAVGVMYPGDDVPIGIPLIRVGDVRNGGTVGKPQMRIGSHVHEEYRRTELKGDELLITLVGKPGACVLARPSMRGWNVARALAVARLRVPSIRPFVKAVLEGPVMRSIISGMLNTTVQPTLNLKEIRSLPVPVPDDLREAQRIGEVSELFNARIDLVRQTNATLESIAQALFKSWFIDFDPVRAKAEGREPEGMDAATATLFPTEFEESALGLIPKGWRVSTLAEHVSAERGLSYKGAGLRDAGQGVPMHNLNSVLEGGGYKYAGLKHYSGDFKDRHTVSGGEVIVANTEQGHEHRLIGFPAIVPMRYERAIFSHHIYRVRLRPDSPLTVHTLYYMLMAPAVREQVIGCANGSTVNMLKVAGLEIPQFVCPSNEVATTFEAIAQPLRRQAEANVERIDALTELRDTLLPQLISGRLRLPEAQEQVEDALA